MNMDSNAPNYVPYVPTVVINNNHIDTVEHIEFRTQK